MKNSPRMKLYFSIGVAVSLFVTAVLAGPMDDLSEEMVSQDMTSDELWEMNKDNNAYQESIPQGDNEYLIEGPTVQAPEKGLPMTMLLPIESAAELMHMESNPPKQEEETGSVQGGSRIITQGSTIAFEYRANRGCWLGCAGHYCGGATCPGGHFYGARWNHCWGEVFQIYRLLGSGRINSGDFVGLYFPRYGRWFSLYRHRAHLQTCPGRPNSVTGFHHCGSWFYCGAEVFQIYAQGKRIGQPINERDTVVLYFPIFRSYVYFPRNGHQTITTNRCLRGRPPVNYHQCPDNLLYITTRK